MASTRKPLIVNASAEQIQEIPSGDSLDGIVNLTCTGTVQAEQITSTDDINANSGTVTANAFQGGTFTGDGSGLTGVVPLGAIVMWSGTGSSTAVPTGWTLCDGNGGTAVNGITIPDLRDKFIVGANSVTGSDSTYPGVSMNQTGGSANAVLLSHTHTMTQSWSTDDGGVHVPSGEPQSGSDLTNISNTGIDNTGTVKTDGSVTGTNANLPPWLALAFIIRTS